MKQNKHLYMLKMLGHKIQLQTKKHESDWKTLSKNCPYRKKIKGEDDFKCTHKDCKKIEPLYVVLFCRFFNCYYMR